MISRFPIFVAKRYLGSKRREIFISIITIISVLSVALSVVVLNVTLAIMTGFKEELRDKLVDAQAHVVVRRIGGPLLRWQEAISQIQLEPSVKSASPYTYNQALIMSEGTARGILVRGLNNDKASHQKIAKQLPADEIWNALFTRHVVTVDRPDGTSDTTELPPLVVGKALAQTLDLHPGGIVSLMAPEGSAGPQGLVPRIKRFVVVGIYASGLQEYEQGVAYTSLTEGQQFFKMGSSISAIDVSVMDLYRADVTAEKIQQKLGGISSGFVAQDWSELNRAFWDAIQLEERVYFIVLLLLILIASFTIVSTLVMVVLEKSREIAVLKSIGADDTTILLIFLYQGCLISGVGVVLGTVLGVGGCLALEKIGFPIPEAVFSVSNVPVRMIPLNFVIVSISAFVIASLAGVYPAWRAAKLKPADALRFE